jgi:hypothetical protein
MFGESNLEQNIDAPILHNATKNKVILGNSHKQKNEKIDIDNGNKVAYTYRIKQRRWDFLPARFFIFTK